MARFGTTQPSRLDVLKDVRTAEIKRHNFTLFWTVSNSVFFNNKQESPAIADKPARRESIPKIDVIRPAYNVVADNTGLSSFV